MNQDFKAKVDATICVVCHALIDGDATALERTGVVIDFANCGRHVAGRWDKRVVRQPNPQPEKVSIP